MTVSDLKQYRGVLRKQEIKTLRGQILAGDSPAAEKGLSKILMRRIKRNG